MYQSEEQGQEVSIREMYITALDLFQNQNRYCESLEWVEKILEIEKMNNEALILKVECLHALHRNEEVVQLADVILNIDPKQYDTLKIKVLALSLLGKHEEVMIIADRILQYNPMPQNVLWSIGIYRN